MSQLPSRVAYRSFNRGGIAYECFDRVRTAAQSGGVAFACAWSRGVAFALLATSVLGLSGCFGKLLESKVEEPQVYVLSPLNPATASVAYGTQLAVSWPSAAPGLDTPRIAVLRDGNRLDYFYGARWGGSAPQVVQSFVVAFLQAQEGFKNVVAESARVDADYLLELELRDFQAEYGRGAAPEVNVNLVGTLIEIKSRRSLALLRAEARVKAEENRLGSVVPAFQSALQQASAALSEQLAAKLKELPQQ